MMNRFTKAAYFLVLLALLGGCETCHGSIIDSSSGVESYKTMQRHLAPPSEDPSEAPSEVPSAIPSELPTTDESTVVLTSAPTNTAIETVTATPTTPPTAATNSPTYALTTEAPTVSSTATATISLTEATAYSPTSAPMDPSTEVPTGSPTIILTVTNAATDNTTVVSASTATDAPTVATTANPTSTPTKAPTKTPTSTPTVMTSGHPTMSPSKAPTTTPSRSPTPAPSGSPSEVPSPAPSVTPDCIDDLSKVYDMEFNIQDTSIRRKYWLCPDTEFNMGYLNENGEIVDGQSYIMLRPNVFYQCGLDGSRSNNCTITGGDFAVTSFYGVFDGIQETVENSVLQGLTFVGQHLFSAVLEAAGDITFIDCAFMNQENVAPVLIQWNGEGPEESTVRNLRSAGGSVGLKDFHKRRVLTLPTLADTPSMELKDDNSRRMQEGLLHKVTFQETVFKDNRANSEIGLPGIIENTYRSELVIDNCLFENNDYGESSNPAPFGYAIRSFGPVDIESTCFNDNHFFKDGPVVVYGGSYTSINNFATPNTDGLNCGLMALFYSPTGMTDEGIPDCVEADVDTCVVNLSPTLAPTSPPSPKPTSTYSKIIRVPPKISSAPSSRIHGMHFLCTGVLSLFLASWL